MTKRENVTRRLRRNVRISRKHDVEPLGDGNERLACRQCGLSTVQPVGGGGVAAAVADKMTRYRSDASGVYGECSRCSAWEAESRYPPEGVDDVRRDEHLIRMKVGTHSLQAVAIKVDDEVNLRPGKMVMVRKLGHGEKPFRVLVHEDRDTFFVVELM